MTTTRIAQLALRQLRLWFIGQTAVSAFLATNAQAQTEQVDLFINSARPVADAITAMVDRYPVIITYEDPAYEYRDDIKDVTEEVRNPLNQHARTSSHRVLVPSGGALEVSYEAFVDTGEPLDVAATLRNMIDVDAERASGARFRVVQSGKVFHVIPTQVRDASGLWVQRASILDTRITISAQNLKGDQMLDAIVEAVREATGITIGLGLGSINTFAKYSGRLEAHDEVARDVLLRTLQSISGRLTWRLLYGPDVKSYGLNIRAIPLAPKPTLRPPSEPPLGPPRPGEPTPIDATVRD